MKIKCKEETVLQTIYMVEQVIRDTSQQNCCRSELSRVGYRALAQALRHHNARRGKFTRYAYKQVSSAIGRHIRDDHKTRQAL